MLITLFTSPGWTLRRPNYRGLRVFKAIWTSGGVGADTFRGGQSCQHPVVECSPLLSTGQLQELCVLLLGHWPGNDGGRFRFMSPQSSDGVSSRVIVRLWLAAIYRSAIFFWVMTDVLSYIWSWQILKHWGVYKVGGEGEGGRLKRRSLASTGSLYRGGHSFQTLVVYDNNG